MKTCLCALALVCCAFLSHAQSALGSSDNNRKEAIVRTPANLYSHSDIPGVRMKRTGTTLTILGSVFMAGGIALVSTADALYYSSATTTNNGTVEEGDPKGGFGVLMIAAGTGMLVPGIIFWSKGSKKYKAYQESQNVSLNLSGKGLSLRWRF